MKGYCSTCAVLVEMEDIQTVRLVNKQYIHRGYCPNKDRTLIFKVIPDTEMLIVPPGHYFPKTVYVGKDTPAKIVNDRNGQQIIKGKTVLVTEPKDKNVKTLAQIKEEINEDQKSSITDSKRADFDIGKG